MAAIPRTSTNWNVKAGDVLNFESLGIAITLVHKSGQHARLHIVAPLNVPITKDAGSGSQDSANHVPSMEYSRRS